MDGGDADRPHIGEMYSDGVGIWPYPAFAHSDIFILTGVWLCV